MKYIFNFLITISLSLIVIGLGIVNKDKIINLINPNMAISAPIKNEYFRDYDFLYVQNTDNFTPTNKQELLNVYYSGLNSGALEFSFYCPEEYGACLNEVKELAMNQETLSDINNYVHPYNQFQHIETEYDSKGRVTVTITKTYSDSDIEQINNKVDELIVNLTNGSKSDEENIRSVHDYIINNTKYDKGRSDFGNETYHSNTAYGPLFEGWAICGGYSDAMQLFLERLGIKNFKISSAKHVWNAVLIDNTWYHLDLTWDDPYNETIDTLKHTYFLIDTKSLLNNNLDQHDFLQDHYLEFKYS